MVVYDTGYTSVKAIAVYYCLVCCCKNYQNLAVILLAQHYTMRLAVRFVTMNSAAASLSNGREKKYP